LGRPPISDPVSEKGFGFTALVNLNLRHRNEHGHQNKTMIKHTVAYEQWQMLSLLVYPRLDQCHVTSTQSET
jgi:hypothetical protein